jgi:hypothetical protein
LINFIYLQDIQKVFSEGFPGLYYTKDEALKAIDACEKVISTIKELL